MKQGFFAGSMVIFFVVWFGQLVSLIGSGLTSFALGVWVYQNSQSVTQFALITLSITLPALIISPFAGVLADRWNRRWMMIIGDSGSAVSTLAIALLLSFDQLQIWHIYVANTVTSIFGSLQQPAYLAATTQLVPKQHLSRASGMINLAEALATFVSPMFGGFLLIAITLKGIIWIDLLTFFMAVSTLIFVRFPPIHSANNITDVSQESRLKFNIGDLWAGIDYLKNQPGLSGLLLFFTTVNLLLGMVTVLFTPLVLSFTKPDILGLLLSVGGIGMIIGSIMLGIWGSSRSMINLLFCGMLLMALSIIIVGLPPSVILYGVAVFWCFFAIPIVNTSCQVIFQKKVPIQLQGRIFSLTLTLAKISTPLAYVMAGVLADKLFEPLMLPSGLLASSVGKIIGVGAGRGISLMFIIIGLLLIVILSIAYQFPRLRFVEQELPDVLPE